MVKFGGIEMDSERRSWKMSHPRLIAPDSSERQPLVFIMSEHRLAQGKIPLLVPKCAGYFVVWQSTLLTEFTK